MWGDQHVLVRMWGQDGRVIPLNGQGCGGSGVRLRHLPAEFSGFRHTHIIDRGVGQIGGTYRGFEVEPATMTLDLHTVGRGAYESVGLVLDVVQAGPVTIEVQTTGMSKRRLTVFLEQVSEIEWQGGTLSRATRAEFSLMFSVPRPLWVGDTQSRTVALPHHGDVVLHHSGDMPFWPRLTLSGRWGEVRLRLNPDDETAFIPQVEGTAVIETDPTRRWVSHNMGAHVVPFFARPVGVLAHEAHVWVQAPGAEKGAQLVIEWEPEARRAW